MALDEENKVVETDDPNILAESKKQIVNPINRKDVEYIAKKIVEQSGGGDTPTPGGGGLEVIEWDGERNFTQEEIQKLASSQAVIVQIEYDGTDFYKTTFYPAHFYYTAGHVDFMIFSRGFLDTDDGAQDEVLLDIDCYEGSFTLRKRSLKDTKLYKHTIKDHNNNYQFDIIMTYPLRIVFSTANYLTDLINSYTRNPYYGFVNIISVEGYPVLLAEDGIYNLMSSDYESIDLHYSIIQPTTSHLRQWSDTVTEL